MQQQQRPYNNPMNPNINDPGNRHQQNYYKSNNGGSGTKFFRAFQD